MMKFFNRGDSRESPSTAASPPTPLPTPPANFSMGPAKPIRFVYTDEKGNFRMDPEAAALLQLVKEPVGVVSVCGRARQGKSYILNQLLGKSSGFQVASTHRPCTKGLWLWSAPIRRTAVDGTEYNLLLLDSEGIDAYDQTGTYSTQIFSLAVLLSSMFIYNQMGGIDEASLDRLSLVTEMTKHIRVRASGGRSTASELGQFSPVFVWLLRDFYLDLVEDNRKITPRDYLELALRPVHAAKNEVGGRDVAAKNEIRESIRALFPDRECFTLVRPVNSEGNLRSLDQLPIDKLRPEFKSGLDSLTRFVFERTRPKQMGATVMTGPILARITQSFLDALNNGAVPTITSSWQSVEEAECQRAYELATEVYMSAFDRSKPPEEASLREAHDYAVRKSMTTFNDTAVGTGLTRFKYEKRLQTFLKKAFEDFKKDYFREAYLKCTSTIESMRKELRVACHAPDATINTIVKVLDGLLSNYDSTCHGPEKWQKAVQFLQQSLVEGPILDFIRRQMDQMATEKSSLALKCRSIEDKMGLLNKQLEASEKYKSEYLKRYEDATNDKNKFAEEYTSRITNLQAKCSSLEEKSSNLSKALDTSRQDSMDWKRKYELVLSKHKAEEGQSNAEVAMLRSRTSAAEARLAATQEKAQSALEEAEEWKRKYDVAVREAKNALEKAAAIQERTNYQSQSKEAALRTEYSNALAQKDEEIKAKATKLEQVEQRLMTLSMELKGAESKIKSYDLETSNLKRQLKELDEKVDSTNASAISAENKARILEQEKLHLEQKYQGQFDRFEELQERCRAAEKDAKRATQLADEARAAAASALKERNDFERFAMERLTQIERAQRQAESLETQRASLYDEVQRYREAESVASAKIEMLENRLKEKQNEVDSLLQSNTSRREANVELLETLLESAREAHKQANSRAESLSVKLQETQGRLNELEQELNVYKYGEKSGPRTGSHAKRVRTDDIEMVADSVQDTGTGTRSRKRSKNFAGSPKTPNLQDGVSFSGINGQTEGHSNVEDYTKLTIPQLKQLLTAHGIEEVWQKNTTKRDLVDLCEERIKKS